MTFALPVWLEKQQASQFREVGVRIIKAILLCLVVSMSSQTMAQTVANLAPQQGDPGGTAIVTRIVVSEIDRLPLSIRNVIRMEIATTSDDQLQKLRRSLLEVPAATSALRAKGKEVRDVVAAAIGLDGVLLLVTTIEV